ncbi:MAG: type IVB secretion system protein IcmH/DotU [Rhizobiaceae bacterium]
MTRSKDDPFSSDDKSPSSIGAGDWSDRTQIKPVARGAATVFDPGIAARPPKGVNAGKTMVADRRRSTPPASAAARLPSQAQLFDAARRARHPTANPILSAAAPVFMALGHLQLASIDLDQDALADDLASMVETFERAISLSRVGEADMRMAGYAICETIDDIVAELPGFSRESWLPRGMLARHYDPGSAGRGFFVALNQLLAEPSGHADILELMHACIALGYKGQYRGTGETELGQVRRDVYETLRHFKPRPAVELSSQWRGQDVKASGPGRGVPIWVIAAAAIAIAAGVFFELRSVVTDDGEAVAAELLALSRFDPVRIEHAAFMSPIVEEAEPEPVAAPPPPPPADPQLERLRIALANEIAGGAVEVAVKGDVIVIEIGNARMFEPGRARLKPEFQALAGPLGKAVGAERGPIRIVGHTDSEKPGRRSAFKSNYDLSVARAEAVKQALAAAIPEKDGVVAEGRGEDEPIADNATSEGRAMNRRVELLITREAEL